MDSLNRGVIRGSGCGGVPDSRMERSTTAITVPQPRLGGLMPAGLTLAGRYVIEEMVGSGGMSVVYRGTDTVLGRDVAVKVLLPALAEGDPTHVARFEREARAVAALQHPAVVKVYDTGAERGAHFMVMEYVAGRGLDEVLRAGDRLGPGEAARIASRVAHALAAAHAAGILHRDIKPANVMIAAGGEVKVLDFGIARALSEATLTQTGLAIGTAAYMSPERILGRPGDERSDIYSLGCVLFAMLTGRPPFVADNTAAVLHQQVNDPPPAPSTLGAPIAPPLEALTLGMLAKDPADRPSDAAEVAARLESRPVPAAPTLVRPAAGASRGSRVVLALAAASAALVLALVVIGPGSSPPRVSERTRVTGHAQAAGVTRHVPAAAPVTSAPAQQSQPDHHAPPPPAAKPAHVPPGHGGVPPGQAKKGPDGKRPKPPKHEGKPPKGPHGKGGG